LRDQGTGERPYSIFTTGSLLSLQSPFSCLPTDYRVPVRTTNIAEPSSGWRARPAQIPPAWHCLHRRAQAHLGLAKAKVADSKWLAELW